MLFTTPTAHNSSCADRPVNPGRRHCADDPLCPGEQARLVELYRLALAAEAQEWRTAQRSRQQAGSLTSQAGLRAWRAA